MEDKIRAYSVFFFFLMVTTFPVVTPCGEESLVLRGNFIETKTTSVGKKKLKVSWNFLKEYKPLLHQGA